MNNEKRHFLVIAAASRGARIFIKNALRQGHSVTAMCRANSDDDALKRMNEILKTTKLTENKIIPSEKKGELKATNISILNAGSYKTILTQDSTIDAVCCFVGVTKFKDMLSTRYCVYTDTISALIEGMKKSRWVETFYHSSVGTEGIPGGSITAWPANYNVIANIIPHIFPVYRNVTESENLLGHAANDGLKFVVFRPAALNDAPAKRNYGYSFDITGLNKDDFPLKHAKISISREDVAEEILRVATLSEIERKKWHGHGVYLVDKKVS
ncbi:NAD(P)H-binding protein [Photobacterium makurazakiensis]|uniref:NAD(P)H-binding protein n=1 Tax=Photobacterium makurazakiensis TaxID=2910234 RepID=UPI003D0B6014